MGAHSLASENCRDAQTITSGLEYVSRLSRASCFNWDELKSAEQSKARPKGESHRGSIEVFGGRKEKREENK